MIGIRPAELSDWDGIWAVFRPVVAAADSFVYAPDTSEVEARGIWFAPGSRVYAAVDGDSIVGSYFIKANQPGLGNHIANAAYMVHPDHRGRGIARMMGEHSLNEARKAGFRAIQFNIVVASNAPAVNLWRSLGFDTIGTIPNAFRHGRLALVDAFIMHRSLD